MDTKVNFTGIVYTDSYPRIWIVENPEYILLPDDYFDLRKETNDAENKHRSGNGRNIFELSPSHT